MAAVVGGGMVGGALALGLAQGFDVTVIEQAAPPASDPASQPTCVFPPSARPLLICFAGWASGGGGAGDARAPSRLETWEGEKCSRVV